MKGDCAGCGGHRDGLDFAGECEHLLCAACNRQCICPACVRETNEAEDREREQKRLDRWRDGLADLADSLLDSVRDGDMSMGQARARYGAVATRKR